MKADIQPCQPNLSDSAAGALALLAVILLSCVSCRTVAPWPPADLSAPGWQLRQGQAVWKPSRGRPELAGDLLFAVNTNGDYLAQFSKTPFSLASAEARAGHWRIDFGPRAWSGRGTPPPRFVWFQLAPMMDGKPPTGRWQVLRRPDHSWRLENSGTGESLQGQFFQ